MAYRTLSEVDEDYTPRRSFFMRWRGTACFSGGYFVVGLPVQLLNLSGWTVAWALGGLVLLGVVAWLERKKLYPERLRDLERIEWLKSLPQSPTGNYVVDRAGWEKHFPRSES